VLYCFNGHGGLIRPQQLSHGGFGWDEGRQTHSPPSPRESRTPREEDHTWHAGHDTEDGGRYVEQSGAHVVCHRQRNEDSGETTQPEERPSIEPWRRQATSGAIQRGADESPRGRSRQESENSGVVTFRPRA